MFNNESIKNSLAIRNELLMISKNPIPKPISSLIDQIIQNIALPNIALPNMENIAESFEPSAKRSFFSGFQVLDESGRLSNSYLGYVLSYLMIIVKLNSDQNLTVLEFINNTNNSSLIDRQAILRNLGHIVKYSYIDANNCSEILKFALNSDPMLDIKDRISIMEDLFNNPHINDEHCSVILNFTLHSKPVVAKKHKISIIKDIVLNLRLNNKQFTEIINFIKGLSAKTYRKHMSPILVSLAQNRHINDGHCFEILKLTLHSVPMLAQKDRISIIKTLASNHILNNEQCTEIATFTLHSNPMLDIRDRIYIIKNIVRSVDLKANNCGEILRFAKDLDLEIYKDSIEEILGYLAVSERINEEQYREIVRFVKDPISAFSDQFKETVLRTLERNNQFDNGVFEARHRINIIANPLLNLRRGYHFISDRVDDFGNMTIELSSRLDGMEREYALSSFVAIFKKAIVLKPSQEIGLNNLLKYIKNIRNIIERIDISSSSFSEFENLNELIQNLNIGEGIPLPLGGSDHTIVYEINKDSVDNYSFAVINTGLGGELDCSTEESHLCIKYSGLTSVEICWAVKEAFDLRRMVGNYLDIGDFNDAIDTFSNKLREKFIFKYSDIGTISVQKRGTCSWSSLDCWFQRYCHQRGLDELYNNFRMITAKDALNIANTIRENIKVSRLNILDSDHSNEYRTEGGINLEEIAVIIDREARAILIR